MDELIQKTAQQIEDNGRHLPLEEYNEFLRGIKDELDMRIENVEADLERQQQDSDD